MTELNRALFVVPLTVPNKGYGNKENSSPYKDNGPSTASFNKINTGNSFMLDKLGNAYSNASPEQREVINQVGSKVFETVVNTAKTAMSDKGSRSGPSFGGGESHSSGYTLSKAPNPSATKLDSGIIPNVWVSDQLDAEEGKCAPLHMSCVAIEIPTVASNKLYKYFIDTIAFDVQTKAQANIGFKLDITTDFTPIKILNAVNATLAALQVYYYYMAIISYQSRFENKNEGMIYLRKQITPNMLEKLAQLGRRLSDTPVPPRLFELIRYLSQTYYTGMNPGAPLIRLVPHSASTTMVLETAIDNVLSDLSLVANANVYTLMRRSVPQWKPGVLLDVFPTPCYDAQFLTLFSNLPFATFPAIGGESFFPVAATVTTTLPYNSFTNVLDGVIYAMFKVIVSGGIGDVPGFIQTRAGGSGDLINTRWSYYEVAGVKKFYSVPTSSFLSRARPETYQLSDSGTTLATLHLPGADKCKGVSAESVGETCNKVIDFLMSLDLIRNDNIRAGVYSTSVSTQMKESNTKPSKSRAKKRK